MRGGFSYVIYEFNITAAIIIWLSSAGIHHLEYLQRSGSTFISLKSSSLPVITLASDGSFKAECSPENHFSASQRGNYTIEWMFSITVKTLSTNSLQNWD